MVAAPSGFRPDAEAGQTERSEVGREAVEQFRREVAEYKKTGFLAMLVHDESRCRNSEDELLLLGAAMHEAGLADNPLAVIDGGTVCVPVELNCPVTGKPTTFQ